MSLGMKCARPDVQPADPARASTNIYAVLPDVIVPVAPLRRARIGLDQTIIGTCCCSGSCAPPEKHDDTGYRSD